MSAKNATARVAARLRQRRNLHQFERAVRTADSPAMQQELLVAATRANFTR
jgi:hypothetical protein